ncbi:MAG: cation transporter dimerization domain-containing protein [Pirellulales bacterium]|nr:cation transporter dimerization domain-containing protein [Thermoguttaceae bacterium]MDD4786851.1 cation transporter dimerization domain-containing protein [Pirellulales bacterium]MDI9442903.1 cation transporter dimerization domain-containing protein [Planctomycetota bacterium]
MPHIEPAGEDGAQVRAAPAANEEVERAFQLFARQQPAAPRVHDVQVQRTGGSLAVSCHCTLDAGMTITAAHELTRRMGAHLRAAVGRVDRVVIHVEPPDAK